MMPAPAIGVAMDGARPTRARVEYGHVRLACDWPAGPTALRGAIVAALGGPEAHVDLHGHEPGGAGRHARATVLYRVHRGRPIVWAYGPRALDHLQAIARIDVLDDPTGAPILVESAELETSAVDVGVHKSRWLRYESATQYFPSAVQTARRPRKQDGPELAAWAGWCLAESIRGWLADVGVEHHPREVHVHVADVSHERVAWRGQPETGCWGIRARFVSNAILPDGVGLGQHPAEGFGEVRRC